MVLAMAADAFGTAGDEYDFIFEPSPRGVERPLVSRMEAAPAPFFIGWCVVEADR